MKNSIAGDATKLTAVKVATTLLTMLSTMLLSRFRTLEEYGIYSQLQLVITIVVTIFMIGLPNSINYFLAKADNRKEQKDFLSIYFSLCTIAGIVSGIILILLIPVIEKYFNNSLIGLFWYFLLLYPWTKIILSGIENILIVFHNIKKLVIFKILYGLLTLGVIAVCWWFKISFYIYMIFFLLTEIFFSIWVYEISFNLVGGLKVSFQKYRIKEILMFSIPVGLASVVGTISIELDKMMIGFFYTTEELAIYTNASKEMPVTIVASSITAVLMPQLVKLLKAEKKKKAIELWKNATSLAYIFIAFLSTVLFVFAQDVIIVLYSEKYLPGISVFRVYTLVLLLRVTYFGIILNAIGKTQFIFVTSIISLILNVILNAVGYFTVGFIGPAIATFLSISITAFIQLLYTSKVTGISFQKIFPWKSLGKITFYNICIGTVMFMTKGILPLEKNIGSIFETIILCGIGGLIYLSLEKKVIRKLWKSLNNDDEEKYNVEGNN